MIRKFTILIIAALFACNLASAQLISELEPNPSGADPADQDIEISGIASEVFSGFVISIESDGANGVVDYAQAISGTFDANGLLVVSIPNLENPSFTILLTSEFTGDVGSTD
ncbi:MAG: hypothetical protein WBA74_10060, partial [Cyclobacteriaceae bacterium]